jgi:hypothetical protein
MRLSRRCSKVFFKVLSTIELSLKLLQKVHQSVDYLYSVHRHTPDRVGLVRH